MRRAFAILLVCALALSCELRRTVPGDPPPMPGEGLASIEVKVRDANGAPVAGARLISVPPPQLGRTENNRNVVKIDLTDASGVGVIHDLSIVSLAAQPIEYAVFVYASGLERGELHLQPLTADQRWSTSIDLLARPPRNSNRLALYDGENQARGTDFLVRNGLGFTPVTGNLAQVDLSQFDVLLIGFDQSVGSPFEELLAQTAKLRAFVESGGLLFLMQQNDTGWDPNVLPVPFELPLENAPLNDFESLVLDAPAHPLLAGVTEADLSGWDYVEPFRTRQTFTVFDAASKGGLDPRYSVLLSAPSEAEAAALRASGFDVTASFAVALAEAALGRGKIVFSQSALYQGAMGELTTPGAVKLKDNVINFISSYRRP